MKDESVERSESPLEPTAVPPLLPVSGECRNPDDYDRVPGRGEVGKIRKADER